MVQLLQKMKLKIILKKIVSPKEGEYSRYKSGSVTQQYKDIPSTGTKVSQRNEYNVEERLPLIEKKAVLKTLLRKQIHHQSQVLKTWTLLYTKV